MLHLSPNISYSAVTDIPIATVVTVWEDPRNGELWLLVIREVLFFGSKLTDSLEYFVRTNYGRLVSRYKTRRSSSTRLPLIPFLFRVRSWRSPCRCMVLSHIWIQDCRLRRRSNNIGPAISNHLNSRRTFRGNRTRIPSLRAKQLYVIRRQLPEEVLALWIQRSMRTRRRK